MICCNSVKLLLRLCFLLASGFSPSKCTIDLNMSELKYLSDHLAHEECHQLVAALHFQTYNMPQQVVAAERKLPDDVPCLELLLHWNSEVGEGKGGTHVEVCHRLNQIGRRDLSEWLSKTVFHELSHDLDESLSHLVTDETSRRSKRVTEAKKQIVVDEAPWLNLDSVLAVLVLLAVSAFSCGVCYLFCLCCARIYSARQQRKYERLAKEMSKIKRLEVHKQNANLPSSEDETADLILKKCSSP